jgi:hypothetical protein
MIPLGVAIEYQSAKVACGPEHLRMGTLLENNYAKNCILPNSTVRISLNLKSFLWHETCIRLQQVELERHDWRIGVLSLSVLIFPSLRRYNRWQGERGGVRRHIPARYCGFWEANRNLM